MAVHILTDSSHYLDPATIYHTPIGPVVAAHAGPGCVAMAVCPVSATC